MSKKNNSEEKITSNGVKHIAKLARLGLTEKELEKYQKEFLKILDYIEKLKEVNVCRAQGATSLSRPRRDKRGVDKLAKNVKNSSSALRLPCVMRKDEVSKFNKKLIDGHLKVKSIL